MVVYQTAFRQVKPHPPCAVVLPALPLCLTSVSLGVPVGSQAAARAIFGGASGRMLPPGPCPHQGSGVTCPIRWGPGTGWAPSSS